MYTTSNGHRDLKEDKYKLVLPSNVETYFRTAIRGETEEIASYESHPFVVNTIEHNRKNDFFLSYILELPFNNKIIITADEKIYMIIVPPYNHLFPNFPTTNLLNLMRRIRNRPSNVLYLR